MFSVQPGKPGSVCDDHLSRRNISKTFKPSPKARGPRYAFPRRCSGWGLQGRCVSVAPVSSYLAFSSLPHSGGFLFCCTFLKVAFTGNCPAPCPVEPGLSSCTDAFAPLVPAIVSDCPENIVILYIIRLKVQKRIHYYCSQ